MTKTRYRVAALIAAAALSLGACSNNADNSTDPAQSTPPATTEPIEEPTDEPTEEPTEDPTDEPTEEPTDDPAPTGDRPTNSPIQPIGMDECMPMLNNMLAVGGLANDLANFDEPEVMVESYHEVSRLMNEIEPMPGMEGDLWVVQEFFNAYAENMDESITTQAEAETAMIDVLSSLTQRGLTLTDGQTAMESIGEWVEEACA